MIPRLRPIFVWARIGHHQLAVSRQATRDGSYRYMIKHYHYQAVSVKHVLYTGQYGILGNPSVRYGTVRYHSLRYGTVQRGR